MGIYGHADGTVEHVSVREKKWGAGPRKHKLSCCRECGSERVDLWYVGASVGGWVVICSDCHTTSDRQYKVEEDAVNAWNGDDGK